MIVLYLFFRIETSKPIVNFLLVEQLSTSAIFGYDVCNVHIEAIKARLVVVEMVDSWTVPIMSQPLKASKTVPLRE